MILFYSIYLFIFYLFIHFSFFCLFFFFFNESDYNDICIWHLAQVICFKVFDKFYIILFSIPPDG